MCSSDLSDAKVDMLYPQIAQPEKRKISTEYKIDLKVVAAVRKSEEEPDIGRIARLDVVCDFIREFSDVGSVDAPAEYIDDSAAMRWGPLIGQEIIYPSDHCETLMFKTHPAQLVFFGCQSDSRIIALHGSMRHVLGCSAPSEATYSSGSSLPGLDILLKKQAETGMIFGMKAEEDIFGLKSFYSIRLHAQSHR